MIYIHLSKKRRNREGAITPAARACSAIVPFLMTSSKP